MFIPATVLQARTQDLQRTHLDRSNVKDAVDLSRSGVILEKDRIKEL